MQELIGYIAGALTTICFVPQVYKIIKEKSAKGVSLPMYLLFGLGVTFWLIYGIIIDDTPIILFNAITLMLTIAIIYNIIKIRNCNESDEK